MKGNKIEQAASARTFPGGWILLSIFSVIAAPAPAQLQQHWVSRYNGFDQPLRDEGMFIASCGGFVVVATSEGPGTGKDWLTIKYDSYMRSVLWSRRYNGPANKDDIPVAVVCTAQERVIVTGHSETAEGGREIVTVAYSGLSGETIFSQRFDSPYKGVFDGVHAMAADPQGNVFVVGDIKDGSVPVPFLGCSPPGIQCPPDQDSLMVKYDPDGNQAWTKVEHGGHVNMWEDNTSNDTTSLVTTDRNGNIFVITELEYRGTISLRKFLPDGTYSWGQEVEYTPKKIVTDTAGNVYLMGEKKNYFESYFYAEKYDPSGNRSWSSQLEVDEIRDIGIDDLGNAYVTGSEIAPRTLSDYDIVSVKYDPNGNQLWMARYNNGFSDRAHSLMAYPGGGIQVAGYSENTDRNSDLINIHYGPEGNELGVLRVRPDSPYLYGGTITIHGESLLETGYKQVFLDDGRYSNECVLTYYMTQNYTVSKTYLNPMVEDVSRSIAVDAMGGVYVTGSSYDPSTGKDYATVKYDSHGKQLWVARYDGPGHGLDEPAAMALDSKGNVIVTGRSTGLNENNDFATVKYDPLGSQLWAARYNGQFNTSDVAAAVAVGGNGSIYVAGFSSSRFTTVAYDENGNQLWMSLHDRGGTSIATAVAADAEGNCYVTGYSTDNTISAEDIATIKYDRNGNQKWVSLYHSAREWAADIALDSQGNVYVAGYIKQMNGSPMGYVTIKYAPGGNQLWAVPYNNSGTASDLAVDSLGNVYVMGYGSYMFVLSYMALLYDSGGNQKWMARIPGRSLTEDLKSALALGQEGNVFVAYGIVSPDNDQDIGVAGYDGSGNQFWSATYDGPASGIDYPQALAVDALGNVYVTGYSNGNGMGLDFATIKYGSGPMEIPFRRGDASADGFLNITDTIYILRYLYLGGEDPPCLDAADTDDGGEVNITDVIRILGYLYIGGEPPKEPLEECGYDPPGDQLTCESFPPCMQ